MVDCALFSKLIFSPANMSSRSFSRPASFARSTRSLIVSSVTKFLEKSNRVSEPSASFLNVWLNFSNRWNDLVECQKHRLTTYLRVLFEVLLQYNVLSELLVVALESRPGGKIGGLCESRHVELRSW